MKRHVDALYAADDSGRLLRVNEENGGTAPLFFLGRTRAGNIWRFRSGLDKKVVGEMSRLCELEGPLPNEPNELPHYSNEYLQILDGYSGQRIIDTGPAYYFPNAFRAQPSQVVLVSKANVEILRRYLPEWIPDIGREGAMYAKLVEGDAVSVCCSVRVTNEAHEAGVETRPGFRRRGYAADAAAAWAADVRRRGCVPLYSTSWNNIASQNVARKLGLALIGSDFQIF